MTEGTIQNLIDWIQPRDNFAIIPHVNPDGDCLGSGVALKILLEKLGKHAFVCCQDSVPHMYRSLPQKECIVRPEEAPFQPEALLFEDVSDFARAADRGAFSRNGNVEPKDWALMDHHETNGGFAPVSVIDPESPATGVLVMRLLDALGLPLTDMDMVICLYIAISTDTGNFCYSNTTPEAARYFSRFLEAGLDIDTYSLYVHRERTIARLKLLAMAVDHAHIQCSGKFIYTQITQQMYDECHATHEDTEGIVSTLQDIEGVVLAMTIEARDNGKTTKFSFRSKGNLDVAALARHFGGGGHKNASGLNLPCPVEEAKEKVVPYFAQAVEQEG